MIGKEVLNYTITKLIGKGGMGSVYLGVHKYISQKKVAIKVINSDMVNDFTRSKIREEAEHLAALNHENIVKFQNLHIDDEGNIFLVMEYADGYSLNNYIKTISGLIVEDRICPIFEPILDGIGYAHKHKIIHKDIKPSNIMINSEGVPKILDFGIASIIKENNENDDLIMGTPSYMSPEQIRGAHIDERSDIYALGVLLHQLLTGNAPYDTTTLSESQIQQKVIEEPLPRMKTYYKYVSDKVQHVVDKATAKDPKDRYQTCAEFKAALHKAIYPSKTPVWAKVAASVGAFVIVAAGVFVWDFCRTKVTYYADYVEQWGAPVGVHKLTSNQVSHREMSYRLESSKGKVRRLSLVNYAGKVVSHHDSEHIERPSDMYIYYGDNGLVSYVKVLDTNGRTIYLKMYNDKMNVATFCYDDEYRTELCLAKDISKIFSNPFASDQDKGKISRYLLTLDENGFVTKIRYAGLMNKEYCDINGIYGRAYKHDEKGRVIEEMYLGYNDSVKATKKGLAIRRHTYDENDLWIETHYIAADGTTSTDENGTPRVLLSYDEYGNRIAEQYVDDNGDYVIRKDFNACGMRYERNEHGLRTQHVMFGIDGNICFGANGYAKYTSEYDDNGFEKCQTYYDDHDSITMSTTGFAMVTFVNDEKGNPLEMKFYDKNKKIIYREDAELAGLRREYDSLGNIIREFVLDTLGRPMFQFNKTAGVDVVYNERNMPTRHRYIDTAGIPVNNIYGVGQYVFTYDIKGNKISEEQYDATGRNRVNATNTGISYIRYSYNDNGDCIEIAYYNADNKLCNHYLEHKARIVYTYNDRGDMLTNRYYNASGKLTLVNGIAGSNNTYDDRGNLLSNLPIGLDGKLANGKLEIRYTYDDHDNQTSFSLYENGTPVLNSNNIHREESDYNLRNQITEVRTYNVNNQLSPRKGERYSITRQEYDARGNMISLSFFDANNKPVAKSEGYACHRSEFDAMGRIIHQTYYDENGKPTSDDVMVPEGFCRYDKWGNIIYLAGGDGHGNIIIGRNNGFAIMRAEYDSQRHLLWEAYYDPQDKPMIGKNQGYHKKTYIYDQYGNNTETAYFNVDGKPMLGPDKYHKVIITFTENGSHLTETFIGVNGQKINVDGYSVVKFIYDKNGVNIRQNAYRADGTLYMSIIKKGNNWVIDESKQKKQTQKNSSTSTNSNWQQSLAEVRQSLPLALQEDKLYLVEILTSNNSCTIILELTESKYEVSQTMLSTYIDMLPQIATVFEEYVPKSVPIICILRDGKKREINKYTHKR